MQIFTLRRDSSNDTGVLFVCHLCHLQVEYHWVTGGGQSREGQTGGVSIFTHFVFETWFDDNYVRIYLQLIVIYIIYTLVTLLCRTGPRTNSGRFGQSSDSPRPSDSLAQGLPALGIVPFSCLSYIPLNYIRYYLYTRLYDVARFPSLYIDLAPSPYFTPFNIICHSSSSGDTLSLPMDHTPTGSLPATGLWPSAVGSPLWGSG